MNTQNTASAALPAFPTGYPIHCDASAAKMLIGTAVILFLLGTCLLWPILAMSPAPSTGSAHSGLWSQVSNAISAFSHP